MNKCYVYTLTDPDTKIIFYVGKGTGYRAWSHLKPSMWKDSKNTTNPFLYYKIKSLMEQGKKPIVDIVYENLTDQEAYVKESELIEQYGIRFKGDRSKGQLFNISEYKGGNPSGKKLPWNPERYDRHKQYMKSKRIFDPSYEMLYNDYIIESKTREQIAEENGCSVALVKKRLQELMILKPISKKDEYICPQCKNTFFVRKGTKMRKYCSHSCANKSRKKNDS